VAVQRVRPRPCPRSHPLLGLSLLAVAMQAIPLSLVGQELGAAEFVQRRDKLLAMLPEGVAVLSNTPRRDVFYLTGVDLPEARLILIPAAASENTPIPAFWRSTLYLPPRDPRAGVWDDPEPFPGPAARHATGVATTANLAAFFGDVAKLGTITNTVWLPFATGRGSPTALPADLEFAASVSSLLPDAEIKNLAPLIDELQWSKSPLQIDIMRTAEDITVEAFLDAARMTQPGVYEYEIEAVVNYIFRSRGSQRPAFMIIGSGPNSCVLHHSTNDRLMGDGDLLVIDIGTVYRSLATDLTRTIPVSGRFSDEQKEIYQIVLAAQKQAISIVRPGVTLADVDRAARAVIGAAGYGEYFIHGTSHTLNGGASSRYGTAGTALSGTGGGEPLDRRMVSNQPLVAGSMFTIEPGIYIPEKNLGIRIEDDILVTDTGYEILTAAAPKEIAEIEALMREEPRRFSGIRN